MVLSSVPDLYPLPRPHLGVPASPLFLARALTSPSRAVAERFQVLRQNTGLLHHLEAHPLHVPQRYQSLHRDE